MNNSKTVPIADATDDELRTFAQQTLGVTFDKKAKRETMLAKIQQLWTKDAITVVVDEAPEQSGTAPAAPVGKGANAMKSRGGRSDPQVELLINEQETPDGKRPVFVSVNGVGMLIPRNERVKVGYRYYEVLKNATKTIHTQDEEGNIYSHDVPSYPFQVFAMPSPAEIDAWLKKTSQQFAA